MRHFLYMCLAVSLALVGAFPLLAADLQSPSFIIRDSVMSGGGTYAESASYGLLTSTDLVFTGTSSGTTGSQKYGFIPFPTVVTPQLTAMLVGDDEASVSWTAAQAYLGWSVGGYRYALSANDEDGPYTYSPVGLLLSSGTTGLLPETTYYFIVVVEDAFGNAIGTSTPVSLTTPIAGGGGQTGGGQGGTSGQRNTQILFYGYAHPNGTVSILRDGILVREVSVRSDGTFSAPLGDLIAGSYLFTIYGTDTQGTRSGFLSLPLNIAESATQIANRIFIPPTLSFDTEAPEGVLRVFGETVPNASVAVVVTDGPATLSLEAVVSDETGRYTITLPSPELFSEGFAIRTLAAIGAVRSPFGTAIHLATPQQKARGDFNNDGRVNLVDFSILAYWQGREGLPSGLDLNGDGVITLGDFSILTYHWTG